MNRLAAVLGGLVVLGFALVISVGSAVVALATLGIAAAIQRRRRRRLGMIAALWIAIVTMTVVVGAFICYFVARDPAAWARARQSFAQAQQQPAPPPPAFLRNLPGGDVPPPPPLSAGAAAWVFIFILFLGSQMFGAIFGAATWGGVWLLRYGVCGPPPLPVGEASEEIAPPTA